MRIDAHSTNAGPRLRACHIATRRHFRVLLKTGRSNFARDTDAG